MSGVDRGPFTADLGVRDNQIKALGAVGTARKVRIVAGWEWSMSRIMRVAHVVHAAERRRHGGGRVDERWHSGIGAHEGRQAG